MAASHQSEPFVVVVGDHKEYEQAFLCIDKKVILEIPTEDISIFLVAVFYVFNICYPTGTNNIYCFLEVTLLGLSEPSIVVPPCIKNLLARLHHL